MSLKYLFRVYINCFSLRITGGCLPKEGQNHETALLCWLSHVCAALKRRIDNDIENGAIDENVRCFYSFENVAH